MSLPSDEPAPRQNMSEAEYRQIARVYFETVRSSGVDMQWADQASQQDAVSEHLALVDSAVESSLRYFEERLRSEDTPLDVAALSAVLENMDSAFETMLELCRLPDPVAVDLIWEHNRSEWLEIAAAASACARAEILMAGDSPAAAAGYLAGEIEQRCDSDSGDFSRRLVLGLSQPSLHALIAWVVAGGSLLDGDNARNMVSALRAVDHDLAEALYRDLSRFWRIALIRQGGEQQRQLNAILQRERRERSHDEQPEGSPTTGVEIGLDEARALVSACFESAGWTPRFVLLSGEHGWVAVPETANDDLPGGRPWYVISRSDGSLWRYKADTEISTLRLLAPSRLPGWRV